MANRESAEWELSKENIQPLKKGRKVEKLAQDPRAIESERQTYEANLRFYKGPDPLKPWHEYILWLEQTFPKGGSEGGLNTLLTKCMTEFKSNPQCNQDPRYLDVWIKYANNSSKPLDCYNFMYRENLCTECSGFYIAWANQLEEMAQVKRAEMVYKSALSKEFPPEEKELLASKHEQFQTRVAKKVMEDLSKGEAEGSNAKEEREALSRLKGRGKKQVVGSVRVGNARINSGPGVLVHQDIHEGNASKPKFSVLDENSSSGVPEVILPVGPSNNENLPCTPAQNRENELAPGKWTSSRIGKKSLAVPLNQIGAKPAFEIHQDEDMEQPISTPCKIGGTALSTKKPEKDTSVPVALFEPFDPSVRPMYCKHLIYQGVSEISFEELRAIPYLQKLKEDAMNEKIELQRKSFEDVLKQQEQLFNDKFLMLQNEISKMKEKDTQCESKSTSRDVVSSDSSKENASSSKVYSNDNTPFQIGCGDDTKSLLQGYDGSSKESSQLNCNSPTVNTMNIMKKMWVSPSNQSKDQEKDDERVHVSAKTKTSFKVYDDEQGTEDLCSKKKQPNFEIFNDEEPLPPPKAQIPSKSSFKIFNDNEEPKDAQITSKSASKPAFEIFEDSREKASQGRKSASGFDDFAKPKSRPKPGLAGDTTMVVTSLEDFAEKAVVSSTPAFGKRFLPDDDENTCAVPILFKKPVEPENKLEEAAEPSRSNTVIPVQDLSTIMETSRENEYKSSSSSSSSAYTTNGGLSSHFGSTIQTNEHAGEHAADQHKYSQLLVPPKGSNETTGYAGDTNSTAKTPNPPPGKRPCLKNTPKFAIQCPDDDDDEEDDRFGGIMSTYENELKSRKGSILEMSSIMATPKDQNSFFQQSLKASFAINSSVKVDPLLASTCDVSLPELELSNSQMEPEAFSPIPDESLNELTDKLQGVVVQTPLYDLSNPFDEKIQRDILRNLKVPLSKRHGFVSINELYPKICANKTIKIGESYFGIKDFIAEGAYGKIFKAIRLNNDADDTICEMNLVFKVQKPAREWEFYICSEVQSRLNNYGSFMDIPRCYSFRDGSIFASEYLPASLLDILNVTSKKMAEETFAMFFVIQLCELVHRLGEANIIHADIKPDNIMLRRKPTLNRNANSAQEMFPGAQDPCIQLIDFGRSIDMSLCPEGTTFSHVFKSKASCIPEMIRGKPWSYQIDYFGIASTAYCLKFGSYMNLVEKNGIFSHSGHYKRWWNAGLWSEFYKEFLNIESVSKLPNLMHWKNKFEDVLFKKKVANDFNSIFKEIGSLGYNI